MIEKFICDLDDPAAEFITKQLSSIDLEGMQIRRQTKNPDGSYNSESLDIQFNFNLGTVSALESGNITMAVTFIEEANLLIGFLTSGVMHAQDYKRRKHNLIERLNRLLSIKLGYERTNRPFIKTESVHVD